MSKIVSLLIASIISNKLPWRICTSVPAVVSVRRLVEPLCRVSACENRFRNSPQESLNSGNLEAG